MHTDVVSKQQIMKAQLGFIGRTHNVSGKLREKFRPGQGLLLMAMEPTWRQLLKPNFIFNSKASIIPG